MRAFADKPNRLQGSVTFSPARIATAACRSNYHTPPTLLSRRTGGNQSEQQLAENSNSDAVSHPANALHLSHDFSRISVYHRDEATANASEHHGSSALRGRCVDGKSENPVGLVDDKEPKQGKGPKDTRTPAPSPTLTAPAKKKKAGVESFEVNWEEGPSSDPTMAKLNLLFSATFKNDDKHDPALADFRQNTFHKLKVIAGPHKGDKSDNSPLHDDNYSRADDIGNNTMDDIHFVAGDQPGPNKGSLDADDVIEYSFTAEQMIIDLSRKNKVIAKRGPHTAKITGKHPRKFHRVPKLFTK